LQGKEVTERAKVRNTKKVVKIIKKLVFDLKNLPYYFFGKKQQKIVRKELSYIWVIINIPKERAYLEYQFPEGKIAKNAVAQSLKKAICSECISTTWHCILSAELTKTHFFRLFFLAIFCARQRLKYFEFTFSEEIAFSRTESQKLREKNIIFILFVIKAFKMNTNN